MTSLRSFQSEFTNQTDQVSLDKGVNYDNNGVSDPDQLVQKVSPFQSIETDQINPGRSSMVLKKSSNQLDEEVSEISELKLKPQELDDKSALRESQDADLNKSDLKQKEQASPEQTSTMIIEQKQNNSIHEIQSSNQQMGLLQKATDNNGKAVNESQILKNNSTNIDLSSVMEPSEQTLFISEANAVPYSPKQAKTQQKLQVNNKPTKNPQDTPKKGDVSNNNQSIISANIKQRSNTKCDRSLKSLRSMSQEGTLSRLGGRTAAPSTSIGKRKMTTQNVHSQKRRLPNAPKGPTQTLAEAKQYADKIQRFGQKYVVKQSHKRNNIFIQSAAQISMQSIGDKGTNVSVSEQKPNQITRNKSKKQSILDASSQTTQKDQFLQAQLTKILYSINQKKQTGDQLGLGQKDHNDTKAAPEIIVNMSESIEPTKTEKLVDESQVVKENNCSLNSSKMLSYKKTSLKVLPPPKMPPLRLSTSTKNSFVITKFSKTTKGFLQLKKFNYTKEANSPINIENMNTDQETLMNKVLQSYSTLQQPKASSKGHTSSFKNPVYPEHHQSSKGHRNLTKIKDPYFSQEIQDKALALIEEKKQRIRRQTENLKNFTQTQYNQTRHKNSQHQMDRSSSPTSPNRYPFPSGIAFGSGDYNTDRGLHSRQNLTGRKSRKKLSQSPLSSHWANSNRKSPQDCQYYCDNKQQIQSQIAALKKQVENKYERYMGEGIASQEHTTNQHNKIGARGSHQTQRYDEQTLSTAPHTEQKDKKKQDSKSKSQTRIRKNPLIIGTQKSSQNTMTTQNTSLNKDQNIKLRDKGGKLLIQKTDSSATNNSKSLSKLPNQTAIKGRNKNFWMSLINEKKKNQTTDQNDSSNNRDSKSLQTRKEKQLQSMIQPNYKPIQRNKNIKETYNLELTENKDQILREASEFSPLKNELIAQNLKDNIPKQSSEDLQKDLMVKVELVSQSIDKLESPIVRTNSQHKLTQQ